MPMDLKDKQKQLVKWLVEKAQAGNLPEDFLIYGTTNGYRIAAKLEEGESSPQITKSDIITLARADLLICEFTRRDNANCGLTEKAYTAVANDFRETGTLITNLQAILFRLSADLANLQEQEAQFGSISAPLDLINKIKSYKEVIDLTTNLIQTSSELQQKLDRSLITDDLKARLISILGEK